MVYYSKSNSAKDNFMKNTTNLKPDSVLKDYWRNNDRFADLLNQVFFNGIEQIKPEQLTDRDSEESSVVLGKDNSTIMSISRSRDLIKEFSNSIDFVLIGLENQMRVHFAMPVRAMLYEALNYSKQCKDFAQDHRTNKDLSRPDEFLSGLSANDRVKPIISLVIYYGETPWNGPLSLSDMMDIPVAFRPFYNNYNIHVLQVRDAKKYHFRNPDNNNFFTLIDEFYSNNSKIDIEIFKEKYPDLSIYWETMAALGAATGSMELVEYAMQNEGGTIHMCTALENLKNEGIHEGTILGMIEAYKDLSLTDEEIIDKLKEKFDLNNDEVLSYLKKFLD